MALVLRAAYGSPVDVGGRFALTAFELARDGCQHVLARFAGIEYTVFDRFRICEIHQAAQYVRLFRFD